MSEAVLDPDQIRTFEGEGGAPDIAASLRLTICVAPKESAAIGAAAGLAEKTDPDLNVLRLRLDLARREIAALEEREAELVEAAGFTRAVLDEVPPLLILDRDLRVVLANRSFYSHFQVACPETENCRVYELGNGQWDIPRLRVLLEEILPRNSFFHDFEITHDFPGIGRRTILLSGRRVDHFDRVLLNLEDVTERLHYQAGMRQSEHRYRRLFEAAKDGILIVDPSTRKITDCNPYLLGLLGYNQNEIVGRELWEIGLLKDEQASLDAFRELQDKGYIRYEDLPLETKSGARCEVEFVSNLYQEYGAAVIQCNIRDISARKRTERALAVAADEIGRHSARLEEHVVDRTARLRETIGELEMFSYTVAHDMRAPLRAMQGFAQLLLEDYGKDLPPEAQGHVEYITSAAVRMDLLIQDVLTYTTILNSEMKVSVVDLDLLVRQVIQTYPELHAPGMHIDVEGLLPKVLGHAAAISQCLSNLLTNAVKFMAPGVSPRVIVRAVSLRSHVRVWVEDNGIGIDPKDHKRIFAMFERVSNDYEGTGIGLAIVRKNVERLHGNVGLESDLGKGSKFWLEFKKI